MFFSKHITLSEAIIVCLLMFCCGCLKPTTTISQDVVNLRSPSESVRIQAAVALHDKLLKGVAEDEIQTIVRALTDAIKDPSSDVKSISADALGFTEHLGEPALIPLASHLEDSSETFRCNAAAAITSILEHSHHPIADSAKLYDPLLQATHDSDPDGAVRSYSLRALSALDPHKKETISRAAELLADSNVGVRLEAVEVVKRGGRDSKPFLPSLRALSHDSESLVQERVVEAIRHIEGK
jgi:HEAT repeat protein